tara:strand:+ start:1926 stop:2585 length:660 start_codon:yes stop_codon:yes gene_type:complete
MKFRYFFGLTLVVPISVFADGVGHVEVMWYQDPVTALSAVVAVVAIGLLVYGIVIKNTAFIATPAVMLAVALLIGIPSYLQSTSSVEPELAVATFGAGQEITLYKSPTCGCCGGYAEALEEAGFAVNVVETNELDQIKSEQNIPPTGASCHTSVIGDYVVEGHVPLEALEKLLTEKPNVAGIGLPGMPIGTPGMPGRKTAPYEVYQLSETGEMSPYLTI